MLENCLTTSRQRSPTTCSRRFVGIRARMLLTLCAGFTLLAAARAAPTYPNHSAVDSTERELRQNTTGTVRLPWSRYLSSVDASG